MKSVAPEIQIYSRCLIFSKITVETPPKKTDAQLENISTKKILTILEAPYKPYNPY
ncbi:hypothetical protein KKF38_04805 [Patescibacteria group bacterium]|nr:hypothetical protein [Patescibacteria group bacterium]